MRAFFEEFDPKCGGTTPSLRLVIELTPENPKKLKAELNELFARFNVNHDALNEAVYTASWGRDMGSFGIWQVIDAKVFQVEKNEA